MLKEFVLCIALALFIHPFYLLAGDRNGRNMIQVLHAYERTVTPGTPGAPQTSYQFIIVWKGVDAPRNFMWRGKNDLVACKVQRAHTNTMAKKGEPSPEYMTSFIAPGSRIGKDDTLLLTPLGGRGPGHGPLPAARSKSAIYFNTDQKRWFFCQVKKIEKKQPVMMP